jgi:hypothetical protein
MQAASKDLQSKNRNLVRTRRRFNAELLEVTHHGTHKLHNIIIRLSVN